MKVLRKLSSCGLMPLLVFLVSVSFLSGCTSNRAVVQQKFNAVTADANNSQEFALRLMQSIGNSGANNVLSIKAHPGRPITIDAESLSVNTPVDLVAIFNSEAFRRDWGAVFPKNKNGWDAFIAVLNTAVQVTNNPVPWLASALKAGFDRAGNTFTGDSNSVASEGSTIDNSQIDRSDSSMNGLQVLPIDTETTPLNVGNPPEAEAENESDTEGEQ